VEVVIREKGKDKAHIIYICIYICVYIYIYVYICVWVWGGWVGGWVQIKEISLIPLFFVPMGWVVSCQASPSLWGEEKNGYRLTPITSQCPASLMAMREGGREGGREGRKKGGREGESIR